MLFFSPAVISVSVVCVVSLCDTYRACFLLGSNLKVNQLKSWSSAHRKSLKLCDWMVVSEMHLGRRSWILQYQALCSFDVLSKNPVFSVNLLFWCFSSRTESPPPFIRTWTGLFNELNGMEWTWVLSGWWNRVSVTLCSLVVGMISVCPSREAAGLTWLSDSRLLSVWCLVSRGSCPQPCSSTCSPSRVNDLWNDSPSARKEQAKDLQTAPTHRISFTDDLFYMYWRISVIFPFSMRGSSKRDPAGWQTSWLKLVSVERLLYFW